MNYFCFKKEFVPRQTELLMLSSIIIAMSFLTAVFSLCVFLAGVLLKAELYVLLPKALATCIHQFPCLLHPINTHSTYLVPACASSILTLRIMYSAFKLNKQVAVYILVLLLSQF